DVPIATGLAGENSVVSVGVAQLEMLIGAGPTRSSMFADVDWPEVRLGPLTVPKVSQGLPFPGGISAPMSMPASPNSSVPGSAPDGLMRSTTPPPVFAAPSAWPAAVMSVAGPQPPFPLFRRLFQIDSVIVTPELWKS